MGKSKQRLVEVKAHLLLAARCWLAAVSSIGVPSCRLTCTALAPCLVTSSLFACPRGFRLAWQLTTQTLTAFSLHFPLVDVASLPLDEGESLRVGKVTISFFPEGQSG